MTDNDIINFINKYNGKFKFKNLPDNIKEYLLKRYIDCNNLQEAYFRIKNNLNECPKCVICGKSAKFNGRKYLNTCSSNCAKQLNKQNREKTCLNKYGVKNPFQNKEIINHIKNININNKEQRILKLKETNIKKYGGNSPMCSKEIKEKAQQTLFNKYGVINSYLIPSVKENCKNENINNKEIHNQKRKQTCLEKYGVTNVYKNKYIQEKANKTKKENGTIRTSKLEEYCYKNLLNKFKIIYRQYNCDLYPFNCDFYIPEIDTYIEIQGTWSHGKHPYNPNNKEDNQILKLWESKNTDYYKRSIKGWTIIDPLKRKIAKENKLNYLEFFTKEEFDKWINKYIDDF